MGWVRTLPTGRHQAVYRDSDGSQRSRTFERNEKTLARRWVAEMEASLRRGEWRDPAGAKLLFGDWVATWQASRVVQASTRSAERYVIERHLLPEFGRVQLGHITRQHVQAWARRQVEAGCAESTLQRRFNVLRTILHAAVDEELILRSPCRRVKLPKGKSARVPVVLEAAQAAALLTTLTPRPRPTRRRRRSGEPLPYHGNATAHALVLTMLGTGLRWQEAAWLRRRDVDLLRRELSVREVLKTATKAHGGNQGGPPKSVAGGRRLPLPAAVVAALAVHLPRNGVPTDPVFATSRGTLLDRGRFVASHLDRAAALAGCAGLQLHDLRRTYASWLEAGGVPRIMVKELLGHARGADVTEMYLWSLAGMREQVLAVLDAALPIGLAVRVAGD